MSRRQIETGADPCRYGAFGIAGLAGLVLLGVSIEAVRADVIVMRGGGRVKGKVIPDPTRADRVSVVLERGKTPLSLLKVQVAEIIPEAGPLDGYVVRRAAAAETAQAQFDLGTYCEQHRLGDLARLHFENALKLDPQFGPAHEKLGHRQINGQWLAGDALREAQGLVKFRGRWVTAEEKAQLEKDGAAAAEHASWTRRIRLWRDAIAMGGDRRREAEAQLMALREPAVVTPLVRVLGEDDDERRTLLAQILGSIEGPEAARALAERLVVEAESSVRATFLERLKTREEADGSKTLVRALKSTTPAVVNRAAWALGQLDVVAAVPELIGALVTSRPRVEMVNGNGASIDPAALSEAYGISPQMMGLPGAPIAYNGSSVGFLTPPAVAPGAVAFGATSVPVFPYGQGVPSMGGMPPIVGGGPGPAFGGGLGVGGGLMGGSRGPVPRVVHDTFQNTEVLAALTKLTGQDFGYNQAAWRQWARTSFQPDPAPARRVPQP
ncbi:MAG: HEAT repeat domain-containing protein [Isosphaeraceae bacterium]